MIKKLYTKFVSGDAINHKIRIPKCKKCGKKEIEHKGDEEKGFFIECKCGEKTELCWNHFYASIMWGIMNKKEVSDD